MSTAGEDRFGVDLDPALAQAFDGLPPEFSGFARTYAERIRPGLQATEHEREAAIRQSRTKTMAALVLGAAGAGLGFMVFREPIVVFLAGMAAFGVYTWGQAPIMRMKARSKTLIVTPIAAEMGLGYTPDCGPQPLASVMQKHRLLPGWDRSKFEDRLEGKRGEVDFEFFEAHLEQKRQTSSRNGTRTTWVTVFRGQCLRFDFHKAFYGHTLVTRDAGIFNALSAIGGGLKRARLESPEFEKAFEVHTTDQVEARYLLTPDVMQRLLDLEATFKGKKLRCAFDGGQLFLAMEGGDLFEPGSMRKPLDDPSRVRELVQDFSALFNLIDTLGPRASTLQKTQPGQE